MPVDIRQPVVAALEEIGQALVVDAEEVEEGGMEVVDMDRILRYVVAKLVRRAIGKAWADAATGKPKGETAGMVVPAIVVTGQFPLAVGGPAKFPAPDNEGVVQEPALLEVLDQCGRRLVGVPALARKLLGQGEMLVPAHVVKLDETDIALGKATGKEAIVGVGPAFGDIRAVHVEDVLGFVGNVGQIGYGGLHPPSHFVLLDPGVDLRVSKFFEGVLVEPGEVVEHTAAGGGSEAVGIVEVKDRVADAHELYPCMLRREEPTSPKPVVEGLATRTPSPPGGHGDESGQIVIGGA